MSTPLLSAVLLYTHDWRNCLSTTIASGQCLTALATLSVVITAFKVNYMSAFLERRLVIVAFVASVIFALIAFAYVGLKTPASATMVSGNASIYFEIDDSVVLFATDCVTARWQADGIRSIKFNDQGVIGQDERDLCELVQDRGKEVE